MVRPFVTFEKSDRIGDDLRRIRWIGDAIYVNEIEIVVTSILSRSSYLTFAPKEMRMSSESFDFYVAVWKERNRGFKG